MVGIHKHKCPACGHVWEHSDENAGNREAHTCTECGTVQWWRYLADEAVSTCRRRAEELVIELVAFLRLIEWR